MAFAMGTSYLSHCTLPSSSPSSSSSSSSSSSLHSQRLFLYVKSYKPETRRKKRAATSRIAACMRQEEPDATVNIKKRAVLLVGISVLPFLQLKAKALEDLIAKESDPKTEEKNQKAKQAVQIDAPTNPFVSLLNGLGIFSTGVLGALYALAWKEKKAADTTLETITAKLKEKEAVILSLEKNLQEKLINEQEERRKQLKKAKEEQQLLVNQLNSANNTIIGLGNELKNEKRTIEELKAQTDSLEASLANAEEEKTTVGRELQEKLSLLEISQDKINLLSLEIKDKENSVQNLSSSLSEMELELKTLNSNYNLKKDELAKVHAEIKGLKDELLKNKTELESRNSLVDELNSMVNSLAGERDELNKKLNAVQKEFKDLKSSSEHKEALATKRLGEREDELRQLKEKLEYALNEVSGKEALIADFTQERKELRELLDTGLNNVKNLSHELQVTEEALANSRTEASDLVKQLKQSRYGCLELEAEVSRVQGEFNEATNTLQKELEQAKQSSEVLASELTSVKELLLKTTEELQVMSNELTNVGETRDRLQKELVDAYKKVEAAINELKEEKQRASLLKKELENVEKQMLKDKEARKSLESDLEEATKSLDEMNRNALSLSGELQVANSRISSLEDEKEVLNRSLAEAKNKSEAAQGNMETAHNIVLRLGKEREIWEKRAKKLEEDLASAKGEILRLRSQINSSKTLENDQLSQKGDAEDNKVTANAKRNTRRRRNGPQ